MTKSKLHENFFEQEMKPDRLTPREQEEWFRSLPPRMANKTPLARLKRTHQTDSEGVSPLFQRIFYTGPNGVPLHSSHQLVPPAQRGEVFDSALLRSSQADKKVRTTLLLRDATEALAVPLMKESSLP